MSDILICPGTDRTGVLNIEREFRKRISEFQRGHGEIASDSPPDSAYSEAKRPTRPSTKPVRRRPSAIVPISWSIPAKISLPTSRNPLRTITNIDN
jgi:hypothetical protein